MIAVSQEDRFELATRKFCQGRATAFTRRSPDKTTPNEDSFALFEITPTRGVLLVADGAGGLPDGEVASKIVLETFEKHLHKKDGTDVDLRQSIISAIEQCNTEIMELGKGAGSTLALAEINEDTIRPYHVGDSGIFVVGQRGRLKLRTISHSPVGYAVHSGVLQDEDLIKHEERHLVSNLLGFPDMRIEVGSAMKLSGKDTLFICSDGIVDNLLTSETLEIIRKGDLNKVRKQLEDRSLKAMAMESSPEFQPHPDDTTFILFRLS